MDPLDVVLPPLGTGIAFRDLDADDRAELLFVRDGAPILFRNAGGRFETGRRNEWPSDRAGDFVGVAVGDVDNDRSTATSTSPGWVRMPCI